MVRLKPLESYMQPPKKVRQDRHLIEAGKNVMYLAWFESTLRNLLALAESPIDLRELYNEQQEKDGFVLYPREFATARLRIGELSLRGLASRCYETFRDYPCWQDESIRGTIEHL